MAPSGWNLRQGQTDGDNREGEGGGTRGAKKLKELGCKHCTGGELPWGSQYYNVVPCVPSHHPISFITPPLPPPHLGDWAEEPVGGPPRPPGPLAPDSLPGRGPGPVQCIKLLRLQPRHRAPRTLRCPNQPGKTRHNRSRRRRKAGMTLAIGLYSMPK